MSETELTLSRGDFPPWSGRGCVQTLVPILNGDMRRTVNGELVHTGTASHQKYRSIIKGQDKAPLAFDGIWQGVVVEVGCLQRLERLVSGGQCTLDRVAVPGSLRVSDIQQGTFLKRVEVHQQVVSWVPPLEKGYVSYRPLLKMQVVDVGYETDEWSGIVKWSLTLEEV